MKSILALIIMFGAQSLWATPTPVQPDRNEAVYNLENGLGLKGYDPVSHFAEHGGQALPGNSAISAVYGNVTYYFSSEANREIFLENPTKYEPTYGGWCAWAMANQAYADIDPTLFTQNGNRMHFFISRGAKARFDRDLERRESDADDYFKMESGEDPRL